MHVSPTGNVVVVRPVGEIDLATCGPFRDALLDACATTSGTVVVDYGAVTFADSSALAVLVVAARRLKQERRALIVANAQGMPLKVLRVTGLDKALDVRPAEEPLDAIVAAFA